MPYAKRRKAKKRVGKKFPRKVYRRRRRAIPLGLPHRKVVRMRYSSLRPLDGGIGTMAQHYYSCNSINDPDRTGVGHQPYTHDQWQNIYNHYVVLGAKITCKFAAHDVGTNAGFVVCLQTTDDQTNANTVEEVVEQNKCRYRIMSQHNKTITMTRNFSAKKFFNVSDVKDNLSRLGASFGSNPTEEAYFAVMCGSIDPAGSEDPPQMDVLTVIDYIVALSEPKEIAQS